MHHPHSCKVGDKLTSDLLYIPDALSPAEEAQFVEDLYAPSNKVRWTTLRNRRLVMLGGSPDPKGMLAEPMPDWAMLTLREVVDRRVGCFDPKHPPIACSTSTAPVQLVPTHAPHACAALELVQEEPCLLPQERIGVEDSNRDQTEEALRSAALGEGAVPVCPEPNHILINEYVNPQGIMPHEDGPLYHPVVAIYSLESTVALRFERKPRDAPKSSTTPLSSPVTVAPLQATLPTTVTQIPAAHPPQQQQSFDDMYDDIYDDPPPKPATPPAAPVAASAHMPGDTAGTSASVQEEDSAGPTHVSVVLEPRSLVIFRGAFYTDYLHRIDNVTEDVVPLHECANFDSLGLHSADHVMTESLSARVEKQGEGEEDVIRVPRASRRLSVTLRHVPKVFKSAGLLGLMGGGARGRK